MIVLLFDVSKLDISDEFRTHNQRYTQPRNFPRLVLPVRRVIQATKGNDHKISILLNKADNVTNQQLMRVYGALYLFQFEDFKTSEMSVCIAPKLVVQHCVP